MRLESFPPSVTSKKSPRPQCSASFPHGGWVLGAWFHSVTAGGRTRGLFVQLHELQTVTANSLCSSLQVESLAIRYMPGMKEADSLFRSLSLSLAGTRWERDLISSFKSITNCSAKSWCCAGRGLLPSTCSLGNMHVETVPAFDLQHYGDSHGSSVHYIFWGARDGCSGAAGCS